LKRYFGIDTLLNEHTAPEIWKETEIQLREAKLRPHGIVEQFKVEVIGTTDDPADDLTYHRRLAELNLSTKVYPAFRPDQALAVDQPTTFNAYADRLAEAAGQDCSTYRGFCDA